MNELPDRPEPEIDQDPPRAPGGADADVSESDVGAANEGSPVTRDAPLSAQQNEDEVPDELQTPEEPEAASSGDGTTSEPSA